MAMTREMFAGFVKPPQLQAVRNIIYQGLDDYADPANYSAFARLSHTPSIRAQIRNGHIVYRAEQMERKHPELGIRSVVKGKRRLFYINELARVSFKKLSRNRRHSNYPTHQALAFDAQTWPYDSGADVAGMGAIPVPLWSADALPPRATNLVAGYVANDAETDFDICIICPDGLGNAWEWQLNAADIIEIAAAGDPAATAAAAKIRRRRLPIKMRSEAATKQGTDDIKP